MELLVNPNGPLSDAGSQKDNGQTGRKLVMDYYGPRVPLGGGAIYGKHPSHVDRFGARMAQGTRDRRREARGGGVPDKGGVCAEHLGAAGRAGGDEWRRGRADRSSEAGARGEGSEELIEQAVTVSALKRARIVRAVHGQEQACRPTSTRGLSDSRYVLMRTIDQQRCSRKVATSPRSSRRNLDLWNLQFCVQTVRHRVVKTPPHGNWLVAVPAYEIGWPQNTNGIFCLPSLVFDRGRTKRNTVMPCPACSLMDFPSLLV